MAAMATYPWLTGALVAALGLFIGLTVSGLAEWLHSLFDVRCRLALGAMGPATCGDGPA